MATPCREAKEAEGKERPQYVYIDVSVCMRASEEGTMVVSERPDLVTMTLKLSKETFPFTVLGDPPHDAGRSKQTPDLDPCPFPSCSLLFASVP